MLMNSTAQQRAAGLRSGSLASAHTSPRAALKKVRLASPVTGSWLTICAVIICCCGGCPVSGFSAPPGGAKTMTTRSHRMLAKSLSGFIPNSALLTVLFVALVASLVLRSIALTLAIFAQGAAIVPGIGHEPTVYAFIHVSMFAPFT